MYANAKAIRQLRGGATLLGALGVSLECPWGVLGALSVALETLGVLLGLLGVLDLRKSKAIE